MDGSHICRLAALPTAWPSTYTIARHYACRLRALIVTKQSKLAAAAAAAAHDSSSIHAHGDRDSHTLWAAG